MASYTPVWVALQRAHRAARSWDTLEKMLDRLRAQFMGKDECRVLVVGLDGAGKTTIVQRLKYGVSEDMEVIPTIGFNIECVEYKKMIFSLWDLGGAKETRSFWRFYYAGSQGIIFVFDSTSDASRVEEAREDLHRLLTEHELWDAPLLVMANKQDDPRAMAPREITEKLQLYSLANRNWCVGPTPVRGPTASVDSVSPGA